MPYTNAMGQVYDSGKFESILDQGLALARWNDFAAREAESRTRGKLRGRGLASFLEWTGGNAFEERVTVAVSGDGEIEVYASTMPMGQGIATSYAQLVVDVFGVPIDKIRIVQGDTDRGSGFGSAGSRSLFTAGSAINYASLTAVAMGRDLASDALETAAADIEYYEGMFRVAGTDRQIGLFELAARQPEHRIYVQFNQQGEWAELAQRLSRTASRRCVPRSVQPFPRRSPHDFVPGRRKQPRRRRFAGPDEGFLLRS